MNCDEFPIIYGDQRILTRNINALQVPRVVGGHGTFLELASLPFPGPIESGGKGNGKNHTRSLSPAGGTRPPSPQSSTSGARRRRQGRPQAGEANPLRRRARRYALGVEGRRDSIGNPDRICINKHAHSQSRQSEIRRMPAHCYFGASDSFAMWTDHIMLVTSHPASLHSSEPISICQAQTQSKTVQLWFAPFAEPT